MRVEPSPRTPNKRGEGGKLRADILAAAGRILETTGTEDAVTLRAVARTAGITAPAIYAHFEDRLDLLRTVVVVTFAELAAELTAAAARHDDPVDRLFAVCRAYLGFATNRPQHYRVLFERHRATGHDGDGNRTANTDARSTVGADAFGADAFGALLDATQACIDAGASTATEPAETADRIWIGLHGQATLQASLPWHAWPADRDRLANDIVRRLGDLTTRAATEADASGGRTGTRRRPLPRRDPASSP
ncbi:TetR/AcrR family transcriptional regulator [uncultured Jatrophihabitans sp.]|uniref:TetR/AcrR family transcriptional regulator n=1 Tax=uncultured Jatrophihabitans sp. TaxID=1610747 RepID=UPI0035CC92CA